MQSWLKKNAFWIVLGAILLSLDLFTKWLAEIYLKQTLHIWPDIFEIRVSHNTGVAFSMPIPNGIMVFLTPLLAGAVIFLIARYYDLKKILSKLSLVFFISGALGNFINRLFNGAVVDFLDFSFWPSFNLADIYLTLSIFLLIIFHGKILLNKSSAKL